MTVAIPLATLRTLAIHVQRLDKAENPKPDKETILDTVKAISAVQIDTLQMVARAHYLTMWSRIGTYDTDDFDALIFEPDHRQLFEYWKKAACIVPLDEYHYHMPKMKRFSVYDKWFQKFLAKPESSEILEHVMTRIKSEGALRSADFEHEEKRKAWWDWKPEKQALEYLFGVGDLMISRRLKFQRYYDLRDRVLPEWVNTDEPTKENANRFFVEQAARGLGIARPLQLAEYAYMKRTVVRPIVQQLVTEGVLIEKEAEIFDGSTITMVIHKDNLQLLDKVIDGEITAERTTFLCYFDNLFWAKGRDQDLWNFKHILEAYKPKEKRVWGYYSMPILYKDRVIGRFDPKLDRKTGKLYLLSLHLEDGISFDEEMLQVIAGAMRDFMKFHSATELIIEKSNPSQFGIELLKVL